MAKELVGRITFGPSLADGSDFSKSLVSKILEENPGLVSNACIPGDYFGDPNKYCKPYKPWSPFDTTDDANPWRRIHEDIFSQKLGGNYMQVVDNYRTRNVSETLKEIDVKVAGYTIDELEVVLDKAVITVKMVKKNTDFFYTNETFHFNMSMGESFKDATLENGILTIAIDVAKKPKPKKITIKQK